MLDDTTPVETKGRPLPAHLDGRPFIALLQDDDQQRDAALSRLLSELARPDARVVRMGNSMRSRLMLEHILIQVAGPDGRVSQEEDARRIARTIAERQGRETRVVLLITQAETLHSKTLRLLQAMRPFFAEDGAPTLQVVFVGRQAFRALLDARGMAPLRDALGFRTEAARPATPDGTPALPSETEMRPVPAAQKPRQPAVLANLAAEPGAPHGPAAHPGPMTAPPSRLGAATGAVLVPVARRTHTLALGAAVFAALALAAYLGLHAAFYRDVQPRPALSLPGPATLPPVAVPVMPGPAGQDPPAPTPAPALAAPAAALPAEPARSRTTPSAARRSPETPELSSAPPYENAPPSPVAAPPTPRVVIHVPAQSEGAEAMSAHLKADLGPRLGTVETRRVAGTPDRPSIRFFHPGDEPAAHQVAAWMADAGLIWTLQDFSAFQPRPSRGTIEVWLPRS